MKISHSAHIGALSQNFDSAQNKSASGTQNVADHQALAGAHSQAVSSAASHAWAHTASGPTLTPGASSWERQQALLRKDTAAAPATIQSPPPQAAKPTANPDSAALAQVTARVHQQFAAQAGNKEAFTALLKKAFGDKFDAGKAETIRQQALAGDFSWAPKVQVVDSKALNDLSGTQGAGAAQGAYAKEDDTIYISKELLHTDPAQAQRILMEEMGHGLDARLNTSDTAGDEGEIFSKLMHGDKISDQEMTALKTDNDRGVVNINGRNVEVEYGWLKKLWKPVKEAARGVGKVVSSAVKGAVNFTKGAFKTTVGLLTFNSEKIKDGFNQSFNAVKDTVEDTHNAVKDTAKAIHKASKENFKDLMQSKAFATVMNVCRFIPIPFVQAAVRIVDLVRAGYGAYQAIKNKSISGMLGALTSVAGSVAGPLGASAATVGKIKDIANTVNNINTARNIVKNKDVGSALDLLGSAAGVKGTPVGTAVNYAKQAVDIRQSVRNGDNLEALGQVLSMTGADKART